MVTGAKYAASGRSVENFFYIRHFETNTFIFRKIIPNIDFIHSLTINGMKVMNVPLAKHA